MAEYLKRRIGLGLLITYGVGVMVGAGIYVLVGAVAGAAGIWAPLSFALAGLIAAPSALSYAELSTRIPEAAGEAAYIEKGLGLHHLAVLVGLAIVMAGTISSAAVLRGGTGYLLGILDVPQTWLIIGLGVFLTGVAIIGVLESLALAALFTIVEVIGLFLVVGAGFNAPVLADWSVLPDQTMLVGIGLGASLAFFAFIGFEDIVNMAEEVKDPTRTLPRAILISLIVTTSLYMLVTIAALRGVPPEALASSDRPLVLVWETGTGRSAEFLAVIALVAALNGALAQIVMAARVMFGLGKRSPRLALFHQVTPRFGTPLRATILLGGGVIFAALMLPVAALAELASGLLLSVFLLVNLSLIRLKRREPDAPFKVATWIPWAGLLAAFAALVFSGIGGV
ncbi:APC family permease [Aestuariibius sp. HNIBRBA575]|uniref:APC family permease n=1 Tax=Aestuariibius sp. HNIBRBA575 TaxID=3233343 RepID=UPI0034A27F8E